MIMKFNLTSSPKILALSLLLGILVLGVEWSLVSNSSRGSMSVEIPAESPEEAEHGRIFDELFNPMLSSVHVSFGQYDGCAASGAPIVWFISAGHYRSFSMKYPNYESFVGVAPCRFEIIYTREKVEAEGSGWWGDRAAEAGDHINDVPLELLHKYGSSRSNFAYHVVKQNDLLIDTWAGSYMLVKAVAAHHNIKLDPAQLYVYTRPDVMPSHTLDLDALYDWSSQVETRNWLIVTPHDSGRIMGLDVSELLMVGSAGFFIEKFDEEQVRAVYDSLANGTCYRDHGMDCCWYTAYSKEWRRECSAEVWARHPPAKTHMASTWFLHDAVCHDTTLVLLGPTMKLRVLRLSGDMKTGINRPVEDTIVDPQEPITRKPLDLTTWASGERQLVVGVPDRSSCWEQIRGTSELAEWEHRWSHLNRIAEIKEDDYVRHLLPFL